MANKTNHILILGGTGLVGSQILKLKSELAPSGIWTAWVRKKPEALTPGVNFIETTWESIQSGKVSFPEGVTTVICCLGTTIKKAGSQEKFREVDYEYPLAVANLAKNKGVSNFLIITAMGSDSESIVFYNRVKGETEKDLVGLKFSYLGIFRPSLLLGERQEFRPGEKLAEFLTGIIPFSLFGLQKYEPIQAERVARAILKKAKEIESDSASANMIRVEYLESDLLQTFGK